MTSTETDNNDPTAIGAPFSQVHFEIGSEDKVADLRTKFLSHPKDEKEKREQDDALKNFLADVQIRVGSLLKTDTVSFLLGAGASKDCGGVLIAKVPIEVERRLICEGIFGLNNARIRKWLRYFYLAIKQLNLTNVNIPTKREEIVQRRTALDVDNPILLPVNYESVLSLLHSWRSAMPQQGGRLRIGPPLSIDLQSKTLDECAQHATQTLANCCRLPVSGKEVELEAYRKFLRKILMRPLNLKRVNIFTLNYDTLIEQAADAEGVVLIDGFVGTLKRIFRPECFDQDLYFPAETTEGRVHRHDRVVHLYKLHGSITWFSEETGWQSPYGLAIKAASTAEDKEVVIYPTPTKSGETLGMPYAELFRRFATAVVHPQSTLFVIGYGFGDDHVNAIIQQALAVPSFTLIIIDPSPQSNFVQKLRRRNDQRVWILSGHELGNFSRFVENVLPDLRDEDIRRQVIETFRALGADEHTNKEELHGG